VSAVSFPVAALGVRAALNAASERIGNNVRFGSFGDMGFP